MLAVQTETTPWSPAAKWTLAALLVLSLGSLFYLTHAAYDPANDAALYVLTARAIAAGEGYSYLGAPFVIRPPGWSLLLAPLAGHPTNFGLLNAIVGVWAVACIGLMFAFCRPRLGVVVSAAVAIAVWLNPLFRQLSTQIMSDVPGAALMFLALLVDRWATRRPSHGRSAVVGLAIAAGLYLRSINLLLVPAVLLSRLTRWAVARDEETARSLRTAWPVLAIPLLCWAPWSLRNSTVEVPAPPEQLYLHSYEAAMWHASPALPDSPKLSWGEVLARAPDRLDLMLPLLGGRMNTAAPPTGTKIGIAVFAVLCATVILFRRRGPAEFLVGGMLASLSVYFAFKPRLVIPIFLLLLPAVCEVLLLVLGKVAPRRVAAWCVAALVVVPALLDFEPQDWRKAIESTHGQRAELLRRIDREFPPGAPIAAPLGWHLGVHTDRPVYSLDIVGERQGPAFALKLIEKHGIVAVATNQRRRTGRKYADLLEPLYPKAHVGNWVVFDTRGKPGGE